MIWCVEDDPAIRDIELYALRSAGFEARGFEEGTSMLEALQTEYDGLKATHAELAGQLAAVKEELQPMKDIRYWVGKVLAPEQTKPQKKSEPKHSPVEQMKFYQEQEKQKQEQKSPQHKKQNMEL